ncbi:MAG TPA: S-methyl-5'-thioadenosine phosphorylase [Steroidobacteraceae bacterium]|nr:S-methyl-5'-thioadenosine phosphorylase [Steroidobacteraceae bacterium]
MKDWVIGVIGGSGLYEMEALESRRRVDIVTPWGAPSDSLLEGHIADTRVVFLPRHGRGHRIGPSDLNYRANIAALKMAGCTDLISVSAVGSLRLDLPPRTFVLVDQFIDRTVGRANSFFEPGLVAHVSLADPTCPRLSGLTAAAARKAGAPVVEGGTYLAMEGPQFSTRAESRLYQSWGCAVIGMTNMPEARLAREAELPYASIAMVTDYDCCHEEQRPVEVAQILECMRDNVGKARLAIENLVRELPARRPPSPIDSALEGAIITAPESRDPAVMARVQALARRRP